MSEYTRWSNDPSVIGAPSLLHQAVGADTNSKRKISPSTITPLAIRNLKAFLDATGWRCLYGLNLVNGTPERTATEASFVSATLGDRLIAFQIGNEPDHYVMNGLRPEGYGFQDYFREWSVLHRVVLTALPKARFAGPDIAEDLDWVEAFASQAPEGVELLTGHHYAEGPPTDPSMTLRRLLTPDHEFASRVQRIKRIAEQSRIPYCMAETNSCYSGGKAGVSDVFGSAFWSLEYLLELAQSGERGVYFHGGATSIYTPIAGGSGKSFEPRPLYGGLLLFKELLGSEIVSLQTQTIDSNTTVYAFRNPNRILVINKGNEPATLELEHAMRSIERLTLNAPSLHSTGEVSIGMQPLNEARRAPEWEAQERTHQLIAQPTSASLFRLS
ncbi:MAG: hypothetical protein PW792_03820 [Acidobacteriaceae bacterium]|nr:hypothetical protein [Acidobacteriaceae bacterium]